MKVTIDENVCASSGNCVMTAPAVFDQRAQDGVVVLLEDQPAPELADAVRHAAVICPSGAIHIEE